MKPLLLIFILTFLLSACAPALSKPTLTDLQDFGYLLTLSPDDRLLAVTANTGLYVYDASTFKQVAAFAGLSGSTIVFGNETMAAINGNGLYVWGLEDYKLLFQRTTPDAIQFQSLAISPDGRWLVTGEQKQFRLWSLPDGKVIERFSVDGFVSNLAFTDHDTLIVIEQYKAEIQEWDLQNQKRIRSFEIPRDVLFFTLSQAGKVMLVDYGESGVEPWNVETGKAEHYYRQMQGASGWTRLSGNDQVAVVWGYAINGNESGIGVWDLAADKRIQEISTSFVNGDGWRCGVLNSKGTVLTASNNEGYIYFYNLQSGKRLARSFYRINSRLN